MLKTQKLMKKLKKRFKKFKQLQQLKLSHQQVKIKAPFQINRHKIQKNSQKILRDRHKMPKNRLKRRNLFRRNKMEHKQKLPRKKN